MTRITVSLKKEEKAALMRLAQDERRDERAQAAWIIRQRLETLGLLPASQPIGLQVAPKRTGQ